VKDKKERKITEDKKSNGALLQERVRKQLNSSKKTPRRRRGFDWKQRRMGGWILFYGEREIVCQSAKNKK